MIPEYDKYAPYIWWCYGLTLLVLIALVIWSLMRAARVKRELESLDGARRRARARQPMTEERT
jgi:heme exporter protein CcmD